MRRPLAYRQFTPQEPDPKQTFENYKPETASQNEALSTLQNLARRALLRVLTKARFGAGGEGALVVLTGSPGVGKTHLAHGFVHELNRPLDVDAFLHSERNGFLSKNRTLLFQEPIPSDIAKLITEDGRPLHEFTQGPKMELQFNRISPVENPFKRTRHGYQPTLSEEGGFRYEHFEIASRLPQITQGPFEQRPFTTGGRAHTLEVIPLTPDRPLPLGSIRLSTFNAFGILPHEDCAAFLTDTGDDTSGISLSENAQARVLVIDDLGRIPLDTNVTAYWEGLQNLVEWTISAGNMVIATSNLSLDEVIESSGSGEAEKGRILSRLNGLTLNRRLVLNIQGPDHREGRAQKARVEDAI